MNLITTFRKKIEFKAIPVNFRPECGCDTSKKKNSNEISTEISKVFRIIVFNVCDIISNFLKKKTEVWVAQKK